MLDAVAACRGYYPLPEWAKQALVIVLKGLIRGDDKIRNKWKAWANRYAKDMEDLQLYENTLMMRDEGCEMDHAREIAIMLYTQRPVESSGKTPDAVKASNKILEKRKGENPFRYFRLNTLRIIKRAEKKNPGLFIAIENTITASKPRKGRKHKTD